MCGRYDITELPLEYFELLLGHAIKDRRAEPKARYNVAPTQQVPIIRLNREGELEAVDVRWGLLPYWSKEPKTKYSTINARAETVEKLPAYRSAFKARRCLVPATGWYEWQELGPGNKQPWRMHMRDGSPLAFAGLWERWKGDDQVIESDTIIVTDATEAIAQTHDRMPVILSPEAARQWMNPDEQDSATLKSLLHPYVPPGLEMYRVSTRVNSARGDAPEMITPLDGEMLDARIAQGGVT
jgi:putative SOS response-associated peptidase YedK